MEQTNKTENSQEESSANRALVHNSSFQNLLNYIDVSGKYETIKQFLISGRNYFIKSIIPSLGLKDESSIENANFLHFASEAWLLTVLSMLKESHKSLTEKEKINSILTSIKKTNVDEALFFENISVILGTYYRYSPEIKLVLNKVSNLFLSSVNISKTMIFEENVLKTDLIFKESPTQEEFEYILMNLLQIAANILINKMRESEDEKCLKMYNKFKELKNLYENSENHEVFTAEKFESNMVDNKEEKKLEIEIVNPNISFFYFAITPFEKLILDIKDFNDKSMSTITLVCSLVRSKVKNLKTLLGLSYNKRLASIKDFLIFYYNKEVKERLDSSIDYANNKISKLKVWVEKSPKYQVCKEYLVKLKTLNDEYVYTPICNLNNSYIKPCITYLFLKKDDIVKVIIDTSKLSKKQLTHLKDTLFQYITQGTDSMKSLANKSFIRIVETSECVISIELRESAIKDVKKFGNFLRGLYEHLLAFSIIDFSKSALEEVKKRYQTYKVKVLALFANNETKTAEPQDKEMESIKFD